MKYHEEYNAVIKDFKNKKIKYTEARKQIFDIEKKWSTYTWTEPDGDQCFAGCEALDEIDRIGKGTK